MWLISVGLLDSAESTTSPPSLYESPPHKEALDHTELAGPARAQSPISFLKGQSSGFLQPAYLRKQFGAEDS